MKESVFVFLELLKMWRCDSTYFGSPEMKVSSDRGTAQSSISVGFSHNEPSIWGTPHVMETPKCGIHGGLSFPLSASFSQVLRERQMKADAGSSGMEAMRCSQRNQPAMQVKSMWCLCRVQCAGGLGVWSIYTCQVLQIECVFWKVVEWQSICGATCYG